jgi:hypothetical protein
MPQTVNDGNCTLQHNFVLRGLTIIQTVLFTLMNMSISSAVVMENFRKFSQVESFRKVSGNFPYDVRASFFSLLFFNRFTYVTVIL